MSHLRLDFSLHQLDCPHCQKQTRHSWPGSTILFSTASCEHCGLQFLIVQNKPWIGDYESSQSSEASLQVSRTD